MAVSVSFLSTRKYHSYKGYHSKIEERHAARQDIQHTAYKCQHIKHCYTNDTGFLVFRHIIKTFPAHIPQSSRYASKLLTTIYTMTRYDNTHIIAIIHILFTLLLIILSLCFFSLQRYTFFRKRTNYAEKIKHIP